MRFCVTYRPKNSPPVEHLPGMMRGLADWVERYEDRMESLVFFAGGGGSAIVSVGDENELQRMLAEHPFTFFADVDVRVAVEPHVALETLRETMDARAAAMR